MSEDPRSIRHVVVRGRVQGVGYRAWVEYAAGKRKLEGWVRNRHDGSVEAIFSGPAKTVGAMVEECRRGPPAAWVEDVTHKESTQEELARRGALGFAILDTD